jgi:hypothetical protein
LVVFALLSLFVGIARSAITIDVTVSADRSAAATTIATGAFSATSGNELLLAFISTDYASGANTTVTNVTTPGLTWTLVRRTNVQSGTSEIWRAFSAAKLTSVTVSATLSQSVTSSIAVMSFAGVDVSGTNGSGAIGATGTANSTRGAPSANLTTTRSGSWVVGVGNDFDNGISRTVASGQTLVHQYLSPSGDTYWMQRQSATTPALGTSVAISDTAPATDRYNLSICEILASSVAPQTFSISGTISPVAAGAGAKVSLSGAATASVTADGSGNYSFAGLSNGAYTVTPPLSGYTFTPTSQAVTINNANATGVNFSGQLVGQPQVTGQWVTLAYPMPINPIHVGLLHTGKVLVVAGSEDNPSEHDLSLSKAALWDLGSGNIAKGTITQTKNLTWDVFCNGWAFFPDGRCLIIGGTIAYNPFTGDPRTTVFDPATQSFSQMQYMAHGRWYATGIVLADGRMMTFAGDDENGVRNQTVEFYTVGAGWSTPYTAPFVPNNYPWLHVLPDGRVFNSGCSPVTSMFNPSLPSPTWTYNIGITTTGLNRNFGSSVLLPLLPANNYAARVMVLGGGITTTATATTELIDFSKATPAWARLPDMPSGARVDGNVVILPNGKLFAQGGSGIHLNATTATLGADMFDPATLTWSSPNPGGAGFAKFVRMYHSVALLLPDATVATAGSNPNTSTWDNHIEIYTPPYLFDANGNLATRPVITSTPAAIGYNSAPFQVQTPDALNIKQVVLIKPGSDTHGYDMEQRLLGLTFTAAAGTLTVNSPPNSNLAPPGYYLLFVLNQAGVPSVAKFVLVSPNPTDLPPKGKITAPSGDVTITEGQSINFTGSATDADGSVKTYSWFFPEGAPESSGAPSPGAIQFPEAGTYVASLTTVDDKGVNDPSPPTRTITVQGPGAGVAVDATASSDVATSASTVSTAVSTTSANELLLAFVATDNPSGANTTVTGVTGGGVSWTLVRRTNVQSGTSEVWRAFSPSALSNVTVTATLSKGTASSMTVMSFSGVDGTGIGGSGAIGATSTGNSNGGAPTASLTTTRAGSLVVGVGNDYDNAISRTPGTGQTVVHQYLPPVGDTFWVQRQSATTPAIGTVVTINDTAPTTDRYNLTICEILPGL